MHGSAWPTRTHTQGTLARSPASTLAPSFSSPSFCRPPAPPPLSLSRIASTGRPPGFSRAKAFALGRCPFSRRAALFPALLLLGRAPPFPRDRLCRFLPALFAVPAPAARASVSLPHRLGLSRKVARRARALSGAARQRREGQHKSSSAVLPCDAGSLSTMTVSAACTAKTSGETGAGGDAQGA